MDNALMVSKISKDLHFRNQTTKSNRYAHFVYTHHFDLLPPQHRLLQLNILPLVFVRCPPTEEGLVAGPRLHAVISPLGNRIIYLPQRRVRMGSE